ncbi:unnamed protein product [Lactuca virosa]|uniref:Uncharacterized protein n=1 Tax=Lactuca virosa TaxID=75947 RepID=A0AAU9NYP5_9ASTR|nr:unnamed protein product [Lactuca virosa]
MPLEFEERRNRGKSKMLRELLVMSGGRRLFKDFILESVVEIGHLGKENQGRGHEVFVSMSLLYDRKCATSCSRVVAASFLQSHDPSSLLSHLSSCNHTQHAYGIDGVVQTHLVIHSRAIV